MRGNVLSPGFPPEPGEATAKFLMVVEAPLPPVIENVPMFIYSPVNRCGVFYLACVTTRLMSAGGVSGPGLTNTFPRQQYLYMFEATCTNLMPEAASFHYDNFTGEFCIFYDADRGLGAPGKM